MESQTISMLTSKRSTSNVVGLDIEADSIAAAEVSVNGQVTVGATGIAPLAPGVAPEGEVSDPEALGAALKEMFAENKLSRSVRVGIANQRVVVRTLRMPAIADPEELETAIRFQAQDHIPMSLEDAVLDWQTLEADADMRRSGQMDVVVVAARRETVTALTEALSIAGLKPVGIDVSAFAMIRALAEDAPTMQLPSYEDREAGGEPVIPHQPARLLCNFGDIINLAVSRGFQLSLHARLPLRRRGHRPAAQRGARADARALARMASACRARAADRSDRG